MKRIAGKVLCAAAALALFACTPPLQGVCSVDSDCKSDEICSNGLCLARRSPGGGDSQGDGGNAGDAGNAVDAGDAGNVVTGSDGGGTITLNSPDGGFVAGTFQVAAQTSTGGTIIFDLEPGIGGSSLGTTNATASAPGQVASTLKVNDLTFNGAALLQAALSAGGVDSHSPSVAVTVDQQGPLVSTGYDGTNHWVAADGGFALTATVSDNLSGVGAAQLSVIQTSTTHIDYPAIIAGSVATFNVKAKDFAVAKSVVLLPFSLSATDKVGNLSTVMPTSFTVFRVDDQPPVISGVAAIGGAWFQARVPFSAAISDGPGSGVAASSITLTAGSTSASGSFDAGSGLATFNADFSALTDGGFEGQMAYQITARDNVGNTGSWDGSVNLDTVPPSISNLAPVTAADITVDGGAWYGGDGGAITIRASIDGGAGSPIDVSAVSIDVDGGTAPNANGPKYSFDIARTIATGVEGPHIFNVRAADLAGNQSSAMVSLNFDTVPPGLQASSLLSPTGWVRRASGGEGVATVPVSFSVLDKGVGTAAVTLQTLDGKTTLGSLSSTDSVLFAGNLPLSWTVPGKESAVGYQVVALDRLQNAITLNFLILVDDVPPTMNADASNTANVSWHGAQAGNLAFTASAVITDNGSLVKSATLGAAPGSPPAAGSSAWTFSLSLPSDATIETDQYGPVTVTAIDNVGNPGSDTTHFYFKVDNKPPAWSGVSLDATTPGDATDLSGRHWFKGKSFFPAGAATDIVVDATVTEGYLSTATATPASGAAVTGCTGTAPSYACKFSIPRLAVSSAPAAAYQVTLAAADLAGNKAAAKTFGLYLDDQKALSPTASVDSAVHGPNDTVTVTVAAAAPSGFPIKAAAVDLPGTAKLIIGNCTGASAIAPDAISTIATYPVSSSLVFRVPVGSCVSGNTDGAVQFNVAVTSLVGGTGTASGFINVDTRGPVTGNIVGLYPGATGIPAGWSHDGAHFNRRDSGDLFAFSAYDCHGLNGNPAVSLNGLASVSVAQSTDSSGVLNPAVTCASPAGVIVTRFTVSGNLGAVATSALPGSDNALGWSATVTDAFGNASGASGSINVTRRLWRAPAPQTVSFLALGPELFASGTGGIDAFDPATGGEGFWGTSRTGETMVASNNGTPALVYTGGNFVEVGNAAQLTGGSFGICSHGATLDAVQVTGPSSISYSSESLQWDPKHTCDPTCIPADSCPKTPTCAGCAVCHNLVTVFYQDQLTLSGSTVVCTSGGAAPTASCAGSPSGPATLSNRIASAVPSLLYIGQSGANDWSLQDSGGTALGSYGAPLSAGHGWPLVDGSSPPNAYLPGIANTPGRIDVVQFSSSGFVAVPFALPTFPAAISDMLLAKTGILYVLSNNTVHAVITDSTGGGTDAGGSQFSAWPSACRDPCNSSNAGYACPY